MAASIIDPQRDYKSKTPKSMKLYSKAVNVFAGGINHNIRFFEPYPFFVKRSAGKKLYDVDGNAYTDYWMGHWALILGHSPRPVIKALSDQIAIGTMYGTANNLSVQHGELIQKLMPSAERLRFSNTGSEATMYAIRLARAYSRKKVVAKVIGGWHGFNTPLMHTVNFPFELKEGLGLLHEDSQYIESLPFNDLEGSIKTLNSIRKDIACIITEPLLGTAGCIPAQIDYLRGLQEYANKNDIVFILDEIVTGFRLSIRGAAHLYNLKPDLFTLGKIAGGGLPIGVLCGKKEIMSLIDPVARQTKERLCLVGGGTFSANPMTMSAGYATLSHIRNNESRLYSRINNLGKKARDELTKLFSDSKIRVQITGVGSLFMLHFLNDKVGKIVNALDVALSNKELLKLYHLSLISRYGIFFLPLKMGAFSEAHSDADVKRLISATQEIINSRLLSRTVDNS